MRAVRRFACSLLAASALVASSSALVPTAASAQAGLIGGLGGPAGYGTGSLAANDDGSSAFISLVGAFPAGLQFYGGLYTGLYVNNNGNVSFSGALGTYTPDPFPVASRPMIAPYWADIDTRNRSGVGADNLVYWDISPGRMIVTWFDAGYYSSHNNLRVSLQLILTDASSFGVAGAFDVEFRYNRCEWTTGDASGGSGGFGGTPAQAGFDAGDNMNYVTLPGSRTAAVVDLCTTTNTTEIGVWRFQVRPGGVTVCGNSIRELGEECDDGNTSAGDGCSPRCALEGGPGSPCVTDSQCTSRFCTDGVCCNVRCHGQCEACAETASRGTCRPVSGDPRGTRPDCLEQGTTCGGLCDGTNPIACSFPSAGGACDDGSSCSVSDVCDGAGGCRGVGLVCDDGLDCTVDSCSGGGCSAPLMPGFCVIDGACIASGTLRAGSMCQICDPARSTTAWTSAPTGTACDDGVLCTAGDSCGAGGVCAGTPVVCADDGIPCTAAACEAGTGNCVTTITSGCLIGSRCVADGVHSPTNPCVECNAAKNTMAYTDSAIGTRCGEPMCAMGDLTLAAECDGLGMCVPGTVVHCLDDRCADAIMCSSGCTSNAECAGSRHCVAGECVDDSVPGDACTRDAECGTGFCVDGVCCDTRCSDICEACDVAGDEGTCTPYAAMTDPENECMDPLSCDGAGACEVPADDAAVPDAGSPGADAGPVDAGSPVDAGGFDAGANGRVDAGETLGTLAGGCGCSAVGAGDSRSALGLALGIVAILAARRRRGR